MQNLIPDLSLVQRFEVFDYEAIFQPQITHVQLSVDAQNVYVVMGTYLVSFNLRRENINFAIRANLIKCVFESEFQQFLYVVTANQLLIIDQ